jgi:hypothetical protein
MMPVPANRWLGRIIVAGAIVVGTETFPAFADDGVYRGRLRCASIPNLTVAPVDVEFSMTVRSGTISYQRPVLSYDGKQVVAQETGTGSFAAAGSVSLQGGASGRLGTFTARYTGRATGSHLELNGTPAFTAPQQYDRPCMISLDRLS